MSTPRRSRRSTVLVLLTALAFVVPATVPSADAAREAGDTRVFARVPAPGFPAYVHVHPGNGRVYAGTYTNPSGDEVPARVFEWSRKGALLRSWEVPGQDVSVDHGIQVATSDARGRLVLLDKSTARIMTLDVRTGRFRTITRLPSYDGGHPIPNYATWGPRGALFVSDYGQPVIWRIPPGGGKPKAWFVSDALAGIEFGTTGLVYDRSSRSLLIAQQTTADPLDLLRGHLYRLKVRKGRTPGKLATVWTSGPMDLPDGFGLAASGNVYLALLGTNRIVKLSPTGKVLKRYGTALTGANGSAIAFDTPSNATFLGKRVLVANQSALVGDTSHHAILDVAVGERGAAPYLPKKAVLR